MNRRLLLLAAYTLCATGTLWSQARISIPSGTKFDFGEINRGKVMEKTVLIKNIGKDTLIVSRVDVSCGCTGAMVSSDHIPPGKTGDLQIKFNSKNFSGPIHKTVTINSNDKESPMTLIEFSGNVIQEVTVDPQQFWFRDAETGRTSSVAVTVTNKGKESISLTSYQTNLAGLTIRLPAGSIGPGKSAQVVAELTPKTPNPYLNDMVTIKTTSKAEPEVAVRVFGTVKEFKFQ